MKINNSDLTQLGALPSERTQAAGQTDRRSGSGPAGQTESGDRVEFSSGLRQLAETVSAYGSARAARVREFAAMYSRGSYVPDNRATSQAMIDDALQSGVA